MDTTDLIIPTTAFARVGRGVLAEVALEKKYHFTGAALKVLQRALEDITISSLAGFPVLCSFKSDGESKKMLILSW
ncbi:hypothetical protein CEXT_523421 [Caerostris extrusa]|uniref:Uncharacterized protein n=1 Tax=Caerostris extrusa TaxID=172846 RepID=A0AAV4NNM0_CAEEX|nr:hypothetical protein CEXT_523421 [Caerostris extrusa]